MEFSGDFIQKLDSREKLLSKQVVGIFIIKIKIKGYNGRKSYLFARNETVHDLNKKSILYKNLTVEKNFCLNRLLVFLLLK